MPPQLRSRAPNPRRQCTRKQPVTQVSDVCVGLLSPFLSDTLALRGVASSVESVELATREQPYVETCMQEV